MRWLAYTFILFLALSACQSNKSTTSEVRTDGSAAAQDTIRIENEELEYEIIIIDNGFHAWIVTQRPMSYFTQSTLEAKNRRYVMEWNQRASNPTLYNPELYQFLIDYDPKIDYGMEVNYMLYMYFEFCQRKYGLRLW